MSLADRRSAGPGFPVSGSIRETIRSTVAVTVAVPILANRLAPGARSVSAAQNRRASRVSATRIGASVATITCPREASIWSARTRVTDSSSPASGRSPSAV